MKDSSLLKTSKVFVARLAHVCVALWENDSVGIAGTLFTAHGQNLLFSTLLLDSWGLSRQGSYYSPFNPILSQLPSVCACANGSFKVLQAYMFII